MPRLKGRNNCLVETFMLLPWIVVSGFLIAPLAPWIVGAAKTRSGWVLASLPAAIVLFLLSQATAVANGQFIEAEWAWAPSLGLNLSFRLDGLGLLFALLISGIGTLIAIYGGSYLKGHRDLGRFFVYFFIFMAAMLGVVLSDNLLLVFVFWELTSISSYLLIGFNHDQESSRKGALKALLITGLGGLFMLAGFIVISVVAGTSRISQLPPNLAESALYLPMLLLVLAGAFTKSAQWPFHIWLPDAMQAPTPVSAYLHSATMVKAGVYLLARLAPYLSQSDYWLYLVGTAGTITMVAGGLLALKQRDLKAILAYTTIGWLGTLVMLLGWGGEHAATAVVVGVLTHALYKGALFMLVGGIDHETGTRDIHLLSGLRHKMPVSALLTLGAALSMAGIPLLLGFVAKELLLESTLHAPYSQMVGWLLATAVVLASLINVAIALRLTHGLFLGPLRYPNADSRTIHDAYPAMLLGPAILVGLSLLFGVMPSWLNGVLGQAAAATLGHYEPLKLAIWHGINPAFLLSLTAIGLGAGLYLVYGRVAQLMDNLLKPFFNRIYEGLLDGFIGTAGRVTAVVQHGYLRYYLMTILGVMASLVIVNMARYQTDLFNFSTFNYHPPRLYEWVIALLAIAVTITIALARERLAAIAWLGVLGGLVSLIFVLFSAPDLALTQLLIETLMVIVFLLVFHFLPPTFHEPGSRSGRVRDIIFSSFIGITVFALIMLTSLHNQVTPLANYFIANSYEVAHGLNIVNVILVDFRGTDTLGEISVLAIAGISIYALLRRGSN